MKLEESRFLRFNTTMTNFLASIVITLLTNVVETSNESGCSTCEMLRQQPTLLIYHPGHGAGVPYKPATENYETTTVIREKRIVSKEAAIDMLLSSEEVSSFTKVKRLESKWVDAGIRTNSAVAQMAVWNTNFLQAGVSITNLWIKRP